MKANQSMLTVMPKRRGKPITCKVCKFQFRFHSDTEKDIWKEQKLKCPSCFDLYCVLPSTERILMGLQDKFYLSNDITKNKIMTEIYQILSSYIRSLILKGFSNKMESKEDLDYHTHQATTYLIEEYYKIKCEDCNRLILAGDHAGQLCKCDVPKALENKFRITASFAKFGVDKIKQSLWGKPEHVAGSVPRPPKKDPVTGKLVKEILAPLSMDIEDDEGNKMFQMEDTCYSSQEIEQKHNSLLTQDFLIDLMFSLGQKSDTKEEEFRRLLALQLHLKTGGKTKGEKSTDKFFKHWGREGKHVFRQSLNLLQDSLHEIGV